MCKTTSLLICFGLVPALTPANVVRAAALDLVASWCFNEGSGSLAGDSSGNGHAGKLIGDPLWIKAGANYTLRFDGKDDYIFVSNLPILLDQPFMVQAWIMRGSEGRVIVSQPDGANWLMTAKTSGVVITELTRPALSSAFAIPRNEWHHLVLSRDTGAVSLYLDGQLAARGPWDPTTRSTGAFYIGCGSQRDRFWDGGIDEVRIYGQEAPSPGPSEPEPADGAVRVTASVLQWKPADAAVNQYIYLGTDINLVAASSPDVLAGATDRAIFPVPVALDWNAVYYWKVDTVTADGTLLPGRVWSFTTIASKPDPVPADVTRSWDSVMGFPNNGNWDADTGPERAIDNLVSLKYWHRDTPQANAGVGFRATPFVGATIVTELTFATAGDMPERDPVRFEFYGSNVSILGPFELIASGEIVDFGRATAWPRSTKSTTLIGFPNKVAYSHYQLLFTAVRNPYFATSGIGIAQGGSGMQIGEAELKGTPVCPLEPCYVLLAGTVRNVLTGDRIPGDGQTSVGTLIRGPCGGSGTESSLIYPDYWVEVVQGRCYTLTVEADGFQSEGPVDVPLMKKGHTIRDFVLWPESVDRLPLHPVYRFRSPIAPYSYSYTAEDSEKHDLLFDDPDQSDGHPETRDKMNWAYNGIVFCGLENEIRPDCAVYRFLHTVSRIPAYAFAISALEGATEDATNPWTLDGTHTQPAFYAYPAYDSNGGLLPKPDGTISVERFWSDSLNCYAYVPEGEAGPANWRALGVAWYALDRPQP